jgi:hypothetical protein
MTEEPMARDLTKKQEYQTSTIIKEIGGEGSRILEFVASTENPDRSNDIIDVAGWDLTDYLGSNGKAANPIFAWSHNYQVLPVGKTLTAIKDVRNKTLKIQVKFPTIAELCSDPSNPSDAALFADTVYMMYKNGMLNAVSVGFKATKWKTRDDEAVIEMNQWDRGIHFLKQSLLEVSAVLIPANQDSLVTARGMKSFDPKGLKIFEKAMQETTAKAVEDNEVDNVMIKDLDERIKNLESAIEIKAGSKFSAETKKAIAEVVEALKASHKGVKACHEILAKMIEDAPVEAQSGTSGQDGGASDGVEIPKPNDDGKTAEVEIVKDLDFSTVSLDDAAKLFTE